MRVEVEITRLEKRLQNCTRCILSQSRSQVVSGEGNPFAEVMFIGQGPGSREDGTGRPFVGPAGAILDRMLEEIGLKRGEIWLTNVTRCLPPERRLPLAGEIKACAPNLLEEIRFIKPRIICPLGTMALSLLLRKPVKIQQYRGRALPAEFFFLFPMIHPAAALRRTDAMPQVVEDFKALKVFLDSNPTLNPPPGQASMF